MDIKLDYSLKNPIERNELVKKIIAEARPEQLTPRYIEILSNYLVEPIEKQEKEQKTILTDNRMFTVNKRETSYQGLVGKLENGEDGIYNMMAGNDKNIILDPVKRITQKDIDEIPPLRELCEEIKKVEEAEKRATGRKKYLLRKQLIEMRQDQYVIRSEYRKPKYSTNLVKSLNQIVFDEDFYIDEKGEIQSNGLVSLINEKHVSALLCNYSKLKEDTEGRYWNSSYYLMEELDGLIEKTLKENFPLYYDLVIYKIDGKTNVEIQNLLLNKYQIKHSIEHISSLWRNKIPKLIAKQAQEDYLVWYYTEKERGHWKRCSRCGEIKLAHNMFFSKNKTSKDGWYSICKSCRNKKYGQK
jgi:hypothetical protein